MALPPPEPRRVIRYAYLWAEEQEQGREEGADILHRLAADRPKAPTASGEKVFQDALATSTPAT